MDIQSPNQAHDPREDALAAMRLYVGGRELCAQFKKKGALETLETARDVSRAAARQTARGVTKRGMRSEKTEKTEPKARFRCWCLDGCLDQTPPPLAPGRLAPSHARSPGSAAERLGVFYKTEATREPKRALRDATNA